jgi:hypothetical protein
MFHRTKPFNHPSVSPEQPTRMQPPLLRFLLHWAFSVRLAGHSESRSRGPTSSRARHDTLRHECTRVRRTHLSIRSESSRPAAPTPPPAEFNTHRPRPPSGNSTTTTGSSIRYSLATPASYQLETVTYAQAIPLHVGGSGAVIATETERATDKGKAKENTTNSSKNSSVARSGSPYTPNSYATFKDESAYDYADPCASCHRRLCPRDTDCRAVIKV